MSTQPAFPVSIKQPYDDYVTDYAGLSMRDYFAAKAMQALIQNQDLTTPSIAIQAFEIADIMLEVR